MRLMSDSFQDESSFGRVRCAMKAASIFVLGVFIAAWGSEAILSARATSSRWNAFSRMVIFFCVVWYMITGVAFLSQQLRRLLNRYSNPTGSAGSWEEDAVVVLTTFSWGVLILCRRHAWVSVTLGVVTALFFWTTARIQGRAYLIAIAGWLSAGLGTFVVDWPNEQRVWLVFALGGVATALQGLSEIRHFYTVALNPDSLK